MHPNLVHWDDVDEIVVDRGPLQGRRRRLGAAGGAARIGLSRYRMGPGERVMPVHVHADEEEIFFVLGGDGVSWQDGRTWGVGAGDALVHPANGAAHTLVAGPGGLDVLAFGSGSDTGLTWLPRAQAWWAGPRWLPHDGPNPFAREAAAGPLELPAPEPGPAPHSAAVGAVEAVREERDGWRGTWRNLGRAAGSERCGLRHVILDAGQASRPRHWHSGEEECFVVLDGDGTALLGDAELPLRPGSALFRPPGTGVAHALRAGDGGLTFLAFGTRRDDEVVYMPDSGKVNLGGGLIFRVQTVDYWDGE